MENNKNRQLFLKEIHSIVDDIYYSTQKKTVSSADLAVAKSRLNQAILDNMSNDKESNYEYLCLGFIALAEGDFEQASKNFDNSDTVLAKEYSCYIDSYNYYERVIGYRKEELLDDHNFPKKYKPLLNLVDIKYFNGLKNLKNLKNVIDNELEKYNKNNNELKKDYTFHK